KLRQDLVDGLVIPGRLDDDQDTRARALGHGAAGVDVQILPGILRDRCTDQFDDGGEVFFATLFIILAVAVVVPVAEDAVTAATSPAAAEAATAAAAASTAGAASQFHAAFGDFTRREQQIVEVIGARHEDGVLGQV